MRMIRQQSRIFRDQLFNIDESDRSATAQRFVHAYKLLDSVEDCFVGLRKLYGEGEVFDEGETFEPPMSSLTENDVLMKECVNFINALSNTDHRIGVPNNILRSFLYPSCASHIREVRLPAGLSSIEPQLTTITVKEMVILLTSAIVKNCCATSINDNQKTIRHALSLVHELHRHAELNSSCEEYWKDLEGLNTTQSDIRFAVATAGIKISRSLYREGNTTMDEECLPFFGKIKGKDLYRSIQCFANDQVKYRANGIGYYNLGWVASQAARQHDSDGLAAAADGLWLHRKAYEEADTFDDDFIKAASRIEAAACLCMGGGGVIGVSNGNIVERDMRNKSFKVIMSSASDGDMFLENWMIRADTDARQIAMMQNEHRRGHESIPGTTLEEEEVLLISHWDVRRLWNTAMVSYDALCLWGMGHVVYGESGGWDAVVEGLEFWNQLAMDQYAVGPKEPGFPSKRDRGYGHRSCGWCGMYGHEFQQCSRCKKAFYCSQACYVKDWKKGGHKQRCIAAKKKK
eukprot:CAMPEP_0170840020 /NCGR_PEP_ID=MMETSP0734-20130129/4320_1 /TAXON_ID=186038 /ORGANISM="Fragilariopsis kerguelensis, Strain L26-C5" /LENGTH=516 /DNA_ID=CAMNT_0011207731 /DNA_START=159 /DNA_END=1709 /DNA_ORIENTATION=+